MTREGRLDRLTAVVRVAGLDADHGVEPAAPARREVHVEAAADPAHRAEYGGLPRHPHEEPVLRPGREQGLVDRIAPASDAPDLEDRLLAHRVEGTGDVHKGALLVALAREPALEDDLRFCRDEDVRLRGLDHIERGQGRGQVRLVFPRGDRSGRGQEHVGPDPDEQGRVHLPARPFEKGVQVAGDHPDRQSRPVDRHAPVHGEVLPELGIPCREDAGRDEGAPLFFVVAEQGETAEVHVGHHHLLTGSCGNDLRGGRPLHGLEHPGKELPDRDAELCGHQGPRCVEIARHRDLAPLDPGEQDRPVPEGPHHGGGLEPGGYRPVDSGQTSFGLQFLDQVTQGHECLPDWLFPRPDYSHQSGSDGAIWSEFFRASKASASAKSLVLPDALLLRMRSSIDGICTSIPSIFTDSDRPNVSSN